MNINININELWKRCIDIVFGNNNRENFSKLKLKQYVQTNFKNYQDNRGICGLVSVYSSFKDYLNIDNDTLSKLTKLPIDIRNDVEKLIEYFNEHYVIDGYKLNYNHTIFYDNCKQVIMDNIEHNLSTVLCFQEFITNSSINGHGVSVYYMNNDTIGYIENSGNKDYTFYVLALFWIIYFGLSGNKIFNDIKEKAINEFDLFNGRNGQYKYLFDRFRDKYFQFETSYLRKTSLKLFFPPKIDQHYPIGNIGLVTLSKVSRQVHYALFDRISKSIDNDSFMYFNYYDDRLATVLG